MQPIILTAWVWGRSSAQAQLKLPNGLSGTPVDSGELSQNHKTDKRTMIHGLATVGYSIYKKLTTGR